LRVIPAARAVNDSMPLRMVELLQKTLNAAGRKIEGARIAVLGYAYLEDSDDTRNSPSEILVRRLRELDAEVVVHDPWIAEYSGDLMRRIHGCDAAVLMVAHNAYRSLDLNSIVTALRTPVLIDGRHVFDATRAQTAGLTYRGIGAGERTA